MSITAESKARYLALQQEADFALWRSREANTELRQVVQRHFAGEGEPPSPAQMEEVRERELEAEAKYRELRDFLRQHFDEAAVPV